VCVCALCVISVRTGSNVSVSVKSDQSVDSPLNFSEKTPSPTKRYSLSLKSERLAGKLLDVFKQKLAVGEKSLLVNYGEV